MVSGRRVERILRPPKSSFFLFGPRGTGKSTWLKGHFPSAYFVDLLDEGRYQSYLANPSSFGDELRARPRGSWVAVDEVQRLPSLLNEAHRMIEERRLRFAMTGSSARKLRRGGVNLLGGRARQITMYPFVPEELGDDFRLDRALAWGTVPLVWRAPEPKATLEAYVQTYLKEEIQQEALVRNLGGFARFLPIAGLFHGQLLNTSGLARDAGVARTTVEGYIEILEDTLIASRLPAFEGRLRVRERKHPKLYIFDPGVARALKRQLGPLTHEERGPILEGFVYMVLRFYAERGKLCDDIRYWSPAEAIATEVDFMLLRGSEIVALEVKASNRLRPSDTKGLRAVADAGRVSRRILVYLGERVLRLADGIEAWPVAELFARLARGRL
jgi:predicted AAA+ superfamily ATPase